MKPCHIFFCQVYLPGHLFGQLLSSEPARFQPGENCAWINSQPSCSAFNRIGAISPLDRITLFSVEFDRRDLPFLTQMPDHFARNGVCELWRLIPLRSEHRRNLGIHQPCTIEVADALLKCLRISQHGVASYAAFVPELVMGPGLPVDLHPDLASNPLAIDDHLSNHQAQHLLALRISRCGSLPESRKITAKSEDSLSIRLRENSQTGRTPCLILFFHRLHCA